MSAVQNTGDLTLVTRERGDGYADVSIPYIRVGRCPLSASYAGGGSQLAHPRGQGVPGGEVCDDLADGGAVAYLAGRDPGRGQEFARGLLGTSPLPPGAAEIGMEAAASLGGGELS